MIQFDEATHTYNIDGVEVPSVTTVCRFLSYDQKSDKPWLAQVAAERGSRVHEACAMLDYGEEPEEDPEIAGYLTAYRRFLKDYRPEWEGIEYITGDVETGLAGTVDRFGTLYDGIPCIVDIKTGSRLYDAPLRGQLTGYDRLLSKDRIAFQAERLYALQLDKDGTYTLRLVQKDIQLLAACIFINDAVRRKKPHAD